MYIMYVHVCIFLFDFASTHGLQAQLHGSECDKGVKEIGCRKEEEGSKVTGRTVQQQN